VGLIGVLAKLAAGRPLTWLMLAGFVAVLFGSAYLWLTMEVRPRTADASRIPG